MGPMGVPMTRPGQLWPRYRDHGGRSRPQISNRVVAQGDRDGHSDISLCVANGAASVWLPRSEARRKPL